MMSSHLRRHCAEKIHREDMGWELCSVLRNQPDAWSEGRNTAGRLQIRPSKRENMKTTCRFSHDTLDTNTHETRMVWNGTTHFAESAVWDDSTFCQVFARPLFRSQVRWMTMLYICGACHSFKLALRTSCTATHCKPRRTSRRICQVNCKYCDVLCG